MNIRDLGSFAPTTSPTLAQSVSANELIVSRWTPQEENILRLLSDGHSQSTVASTLGISESAISQHLSKEEFRQELAARKTVSLDRYKKLDDGYDRVEQVLLDRMEQSAFMLTRPNEIASALAKINAMKRRLRDPSQVQNTPVQTVVNINMPVQIVHQFTKTSEGHVVGIDNKSLVTIQPRSLDSLVSQHLSPTNNQDMLPTTLLPP